LLDIGQARGDALLNVGYKPRASDILSGIYKVIKGLNRNTTWVATGLLAPVIFAVLMLALQDRHAAAGDLTKEEGPPTGDLLLNANRVAIPDIAGSNKESTGETTLNANRELTPEIVHPDVQANATSGSPAQQPYSARIVRSKIPKARRYIDAKTRLVALWHRSLQRERSRTGTLFLNSNQRRRKKISDTAETGH
jgi:hypothetical protein